MASRFSAGLAGWDGVETSDDLLARADAALYCAKRGGRNRIAEAAGSPV
jgi:diguanylate cyclase